MAKVILFLNSGFHGRILQQCNRNPPERLLFRNSGLKRPQLFFSGTNVQPYLHHKQLSRNLEIVFVFK